MANDVNPVYGQLASVRQNLLDETTRLTENQVMNLVRPPMANVAPDPWGDASYNRHFALERSAMEAGNMANAIDAANRIAGQELAFRAVGAMGYALPGMAGLIGGTIMSEALPSLGRTLGLIEEEPVVTLAEQTRAAVAQQIHRTSWDVLGYSATGGQRGVSMSEAQAMGSELTSFMQDRGLQGMEAMRILPALEQSGLLGGVGSSDEMMKRIEEYIDALKGFVGKTQASFEEIIGIMGMGATSGAGADQAASVAQSVLNMSTYTGMDPLAVAQGMYGAAQPWMQSGMNYLPAVQAGASSIYAASLAERDFGGASFAQSGGGYQVGLMMQAMGSSYVDNLSNRNMGAFIAGGQGFNQAAFEAVMQGGDMPESALTAYDNLSTNNRAWAAIIGEQQMMARADDWGTFAIGSAVNQMVEDGYTNLATQAFRLSETSGMSRAQSMAALQTYRAAIDPNTGYRTVVEAENVAAQERMATTRSNLEGAFTSAAQASAYIRNNSDFMNISSEAAAAGNFLWDPTGLGGLIAGDALGNPFRAGRDSEEEAFADALTMIRQSGTNWNSRQELLGDGDRTMYQDPSTIMNSNEIWYNPRILAATLNEATGNLTPEERARLNPVAAAFLNNMWSDRAGRQRIEGGDITVAGQGMIDWLWNYNNAGVGLNQGSLQFGIGVTANGQFTGTGDWGQGAWSQRQREEAMTFLTNLYTPGSTLENAHRAGTSELDGLLYSIARDREWNLEGSSQLQRMADDFNQSQRDFAFAMGQPTREEYEQIMATTFSPAGPDESWTNFTERMTDADMGAFNAIVQNPDNAASASGRYQAYDALSQAVYGQTWETLNADQQRNIQIQMGRSHSTFAMEDPNVVAQAGQTMYGIASRYAQDSDRSVAARYETTMAQEVQRQTGLSREELTDVTKYWMLQQEYVNLSAGGGTRGTNESAEEYRARQDRLAQVQDQMTLFGEENPDVVANYWGNIERIESIANQQTGGRYNVGEIMVGGEMRRAQASAISELGGLMTGWGINDAEGLARTLVTGGSIDAQVMRSISDQQMAGLPAEVQAAIKSVKETGSLPADFNIADLASMGGGDFSLLGKDETGQAPAYRTGQIGTADDAPFVNLIVPEGGLPVVVAGFNPTAGTSGNNTSTTPTGG